MLHAACFAIGLPLIRCPCCAADDSVTCGSALAFDPLTAKAHRQGCAGGMLLFLGATVLTVLVAHGFAVAAWRALPWTRRRPLPDFLVFLAPELVLAGMLVLPLAMAATLLLMQPGGVGNHVLGALALLLLLGYL
jgi:hypothetical protein